MTPNLPIREAPATILIIDDDAMVRLMAEEALADAGYRVVAAPTAEDGLRAFDAEPAALVLLDVLLPGMNGYEACRGLREHPAGQHLPIIVMTGLDDRESIQQAFESGATDFITKPMVWDLLPHRVRYALRASTALRDSVRSQTLLATSQRIAQMGSWEWLAGRESVTCSDELQRIHGFTPGHAGHDCTALFAQVDAQDRAKVECAFREARTEGRSYAIEFRIVRPDGSVRHLFEQTDVEVDSSGSVRAVRGIRHDITRQTEAAHRIHALAYLDALTGLANRARFADLMHQWLPYAARRGLRCAVAIVELDRFRALNDTLGGALGDEVLKSVGERLLSSVRSEDLKIKFGEATQQDPLARLGGDEFGLLLLDIGTPENALSVMHRIADRLAEPLHLPGHVLSLTVSVGIAVAPDDGADVDVLMRNASTALHTAEERGGRQVCLYSQTMSEAMTQRHVLESDLRRAIDSGELQVHYQAKVDARTSRVLGAEALVRWQHPQRGMVGPAQFIPCAEESGLIVPLTDVVVRLVCEQLARWRDAGLPTVPISVNLDGRSLQSAGLVERVRNRIAQTGIETSWLEFEVTESGLMTDLEGSVRVLRELKNLGVRIAIDDFGTGYSSLTYLKRFPLDILKIDRSFIKDLPHDANDAALTSAIVAMGKSLNLELIAEGVETWEQAHFLTTLGCHMVQGFLFSKPVPAQDFARLLSASLASAAAGSTPPARALA